MEQCEERQVEQIGARKQEKSNSIFKPMFVSLFCKKSFSKWLLLDGVWKRDAVSKSVKRLSGVFVVKIFLTPNLDTLEVKWGQTAFLKIDKDLQLMTSSQVRAKTSPCNGKNERNEGADLCYWWDRRLAAVFWDASFPVSAASCHRTGGAPLALSPGHLVSGTQLPAARGHLSEVRWVLQESQAVWGCAVTEMERVLHPASESEDPFCWPFRVCLCTPVF